MTCSGARAFATDPAVALPQLCKAVFLGLRRGEVAAKCGEAKVQSRQEFFLTL